MNGNDIGKGLRKNSMFIAAMGILLVMLILVLGSIWIGRSAKADSEDAVTTVSHLYLNELAGRREQVVEANLQQRIDDMNTALDLMTGDDLSSVENLQNYQDKMRQYFGLEKFAFVNEDGKIYTADGIKNDIEEYDVDFFSLKDVSISIKNLKTKDKKVVIAQPVSRSVDGNKLIACYEEIYMDEMLQGISMDAQESDATFSNLYTNDGVALTNSILGGLAVEDNLIEALSRADYDKGYSYDKVLEEFENLERGEVSFTYDDIHETLSYVPVEGTNWMLTYLIRESVISDKISYVSDGIIFRSIIQSIVTVLVLLLIFGFIFVQNRRSMQLLVEKETAAAEAKAKQEELDFRIETQKKLEEQSRALSDALNVAEKASKAKTAFLSNMSHEIRTPMNAIIALDNIAINDPETPEKTREYLEKIGGSAEHLLNLINDILDMSRIESGKLTLKNEAFSFQKLLEGINTMFSSQCVDKDIDYQCHINGHVDDHYIGDSMKLKQVLINILGNAVKFTPEGGSVSLNVEKKASFDGKTTLQFAITDTGIGMSKDFLPHIFDAFAQEDSSTTSKYGSSGLGLAITKNIVEMMNGTIDVESEKGKGTTFTVAVTLMDDTRKAYGETENFDPQEMSVLIIDDDPVACEHAKLVLEKVGISAEVAESGKQALEMVSLRQTRRDPYNLILVDWKMPEMDGIETTRRIREIVHDDSAIIILTAYSWDDVMEEATGAGVDSFLAKPLFAATVIDEFKAAVSRKIESESEQAGKAELAGRHVLLAEDVAINAEIMIMVLQSRDMTADLAENGRIAVEKFASSEPGYYSAVLMDIRMPEMDGLEATRKIREMDRPDAAGIPIIALTANAFDEDVQRSMQAGLNAHLSKPVQPDVLFETLESLIKE
ncbi:MAG: response regulator [Firmicutes bacterium]|nr:response regulator [Bacillota bacterium]